MAEYTLKLRRYDPQSGEAPYYEEFQIDLEPHRSVLEAILKVKAEQDGSVGIRCSCRAAICGSCGMKINGQSGLGCKTQIGEAQELAEKKASVGNGTPTSSSVTPMRPFPCAIIRRSAQQASTQPPAMA